MTTELSVCEYAVEFPANGEVRVSNELCNMGVFVSPSGVRCVWLKNELATYEQRLKALEDKMTKEIFSLAES